MSDRAPSRAASVSERAPLARFDWKLKVLVPAAILVMRALSLTWRLRLINPEVLAAVRSPGKPVVFAFWHGHILPLIFAHRYQGITVLVSEHKDGEMIARVAGAFGFPSVRGSSTRGAVRSLLALVRVVKSGGDVGVTPDGPRGPARAFAPGVLLAASRSGAPLVPIAAHATRAWRLKTWDSFMIPKPFARISVAYGIPRVIPGEADPDMHAREYQELLNQTSRLAGEL